jgi:hypothetical protein
MVSEDHAFLFISAKKARTFTFFSRFLAYFYTIADTAGPRNKNGLCRLWTGRRVHTRIHPTQSLKSLGSQIPKQIMFSD